MKTRLKYVICFVRFEIVNVDLNDAPEWMSDMRFQGVPVYMKDGSRISESLEIMEYFDKLSTKDDERTLLPSDPDSRMKDKKLARQFQNVVGVIFPLFFRVFDNKSAAPLLHELTSELKVFDKELGRRGTDYFSGSEKPGYVDYAIWPFIERLPILKVLFPGAIDFAEAKAQVPLLEQWRLRMEKDPVVQKALLNTEQHVKYIQNRRDVSRGKALEVDYDFVH